MTTRHRYDRWARGTLVAALSLFAVVALSACGVVPAQESRDRQNEVQQTKSPADFGIEITNALEQRELVLRYADTLRFLGLDTTIRGTTDKQALETVTGEGEDARFALSGCMGTIMPQEDAHNNELEILEGRVDTGGGRITVAFKLDNVPGMDCIGYQSGKLYLPPGLSYLWVSDFREIKADSGSARATVFSVDTLMEPVTEEIAVCIHKDYEFNHSLARWMYDPKDADSWHTCARDACCNGS
jgi:hypothetical protein